MMKTLHTCHNLSSASSVKTNRKCRNLSLSSVDTNRTQPLLLSSVNTKCKYCSLTKKIKKCLNLSSDSRESNLASHQSNFSVNTEKKTPVNRIFEYTISASYN
jgi:hypothetical protein